MSLEAETKGEGASGRYRRSDIAEGIGRSQPADSAILIQLPRRVTLPAEKKALFL